MKCNKEQSNYLKLVAILAMLADHIGVILFPQYKIFRIIGRVAFPLFAYQIGIAYNHTNSVKRYFSRLLSYGAAIQAVYIVAVFLFKADLNPFYLNVFFALALGLAAIYFYDKKLYIPLAAALTLPFFTESVGVKFDYGMYGVALIAVMYAANKDFLTLFAATAALTITHCLFAGWKLQLYSLAAPLFLIKPYKLKFKIPNKFFYIFYPLHLAVLYAISMFM